MSTVEERLAYLEAKIATLEEESSEALQANYLTYDPVAGVTGASFSGLVHALGLNLDAGTTSTPPNQDRIRWLRTSDGALVADLAAFDINTGGSLNDVLMLTAYGAQAGRIPQAEIAAQAHDGTSAALAVTTSDGGTAQILAITAAGTPVVFDQGGNSNFVQVAGGTSLRVLGTGITVGNFPNNNSMTALVVNHGLGHAPQFVTAVEDGFQFGTNITFVTSTFTATQFTINAWSAAILNSNIGMRWIAYG